MRKKIVRILLFVVLSISLHPGGARAAELNNYLGSEEMVPSQATIPSLSKVNDVINAADKYIGTPYKWGADPYSEENRFFDCSSFTQQVFREIGVNLKRDSREQSTQGKTVVSVSQPEQFVGDGTVKPKGERLHFDEIKHLLKKGDLIFFDNEEEIVNVERIHHVSIYINEYTLLHATETEGVNYTYFNDKRKNNIVIVKRLIDESLPMVTQVDIQKIGEKYLTTPFEQMNASGFVRQVFKEKGIHLPDKANTMSQVGMDIPRDQLKMGDLVFFDHDHDGIITHVAIYINEDSLLHSTVSQGVTYTKFSAYWSEAYVKGKRILDLKGAFLPLREEVFKTAVSYEGKKQIENIGPNGPDGKPILVNPDSSLFVQRVFYDHYVGLSRYSNTQLTQGLTISLSDAQPGDLLFFDTDDDGNSNYVAFYVNPSTMLLAKSNQAIQFQPLTDELKQKIMIVKRIGLS